MSVEVSVLFVCLGNICRSPTAEGAFRRALREARLTHRVHADSAGTQGYHAGELPDPRTRRAAERRGLVLDHRARQVEPADFTAFQYVLAMDQANHAELLRRAPPGHGARIALFRSFDPSAPPGAEVPDPYYGGESGFEEVLDQCERAAQGLLAHLRREQLA